MAQIRTSTRVQSIEFPPPRLSPTLAINERIKHLEESGQKVYRFGFGQSPFPVPDIMVEALKQHAHQKGYLPVQGLLALREQIAHYYSSKLKSQIEADQIVIGPGTKELIWSVIHTFPGEIILPSPCWVSYAPQANMAKKKIIRIDSSPDNNWIITPEDFEVACRSSTNPKLIILNYPNNPSGSVPNYGQMKALVEVANKYGVIILHDNIYGNLDHSSEDAVIFPEYPEMTVFSDGLSKWCGAGGWRLGFHIFPKELKVLQTAVLAMASETFSCVSSPIQYAAIEAYKGHQELDDYLQKCKVILHAIAKYTHQQLKKMGADVQFSDGGFYFFPIFKAYQDEIHRLEISTSEQLCETILKDTGVALLPGSEFGRSKEEFSARLAFVDFDGKNILQKLLSNLDILNKDDHISTICPQVENGLHQLNTWFAKL